MSGCDSSVSRIVDSPVSEAVVAVPGLWESSPARLGPLDVCGLARNGDAGGSPVSAPKPVRLVRGDEAGELPHGEAPAGSSTSFIVVL